jgi:heme-degrading monooxygenase HmoA
MPVTKIVIRRWSGQIRSEDEADYISYVEVTGLQEYRSTVGNLGCQLLVRARSNDVTEVTTLSWWTSMEAIKAFAGPNPEMARYYPEDEAFLIAKPKNVEHYVVAAGFMSELKNGQWARLNFQGACESSHSPNSVTSRYEELSRDSSQWLQQAFCCPYV